MVTPSETHLHFALINKKQVHVEEALQTMTKKDNKIENLKRITEITSLLSHTYLVGNGIL